MQGASLTEAVALHLEWTGGNVFKERVTVTVLADGMIEVFSAVNGMGQSTPCKTNLPGIKGVGEVGTIGATPSVVNAVADALARIGFSAQAPKLQMPFTSGRVWERLQAS